MTEAEWLACTDPQQMLDFLRGKTSERKLRLFAVACCRRIWNLLTDESSRRAVEVAERFADDMATKNELRIARKRSMRAKGTNPSEDAANAAGASASFKSAFGAAHNGYLHAIGAEARVSFQGNYPPTREAFQRFMQAREEGFRNACILLREVVNNPFRLATIDPYWLTWNNGTIHNIAQAIYDERAFDRLPSLAKSLEEAGCHAADILVHCGHPGLHVRGCWVLDLILGKE